MAVVLEPLKAAGKPNGHGVEMTGGDGAVRRVYPLLATYVADYPEQCLVTCTKYGTCPKCRRKATELELPSPGEPRTQRWTYKIIQDARLALHSHSQSASSIYARTMEDDVGGGKYEPFWVDFPLVDIHRCIAPDVLHQLYQGVLKHLVAWVQEVVGQGELDRRIQALPPASGVRHFKKGLSTLSQVSGIEHKHIAKILLACLVGKVDPNGIVACRSLLHFIYLAQYPSHDQDTLRYMEEELKSWHNKRHYFIRHGSRTDFNIPKFHSLLHYVDSICWLGATDNYNTEMFERLHIDFAKEGWRSSNKRDHFPQMVKWLSRQEKVASFDFYRSWMDITQPSQTENQAILVRPDQDDDDQALATVQHNSILQKAKLTQTLQIAKRPAEPRKNLNRILVSHGAPGFVAHLKAFLHSLLPVDQQVNQATVLEYSLPFSSLDVWHQFKFTPASQFEDDAVQEIVKSIPALKDSAGSRYDTVIVLDNDKAESTAVEGRAFAYLLFITLTSIPRM